MNKWLVGVGLVGVMLVIIGYFSPWVALYSKAGGEAIFRYGGFFAREVLALGILAIFCIFGAAIIPTGKEYTSIATKIMGVIVAVCGVAILVFLADAFNTIQMLFGLFAEVRHDYGFLISIAGGIFVLLAGIFGMFD